MTSNTLRRDGKIGKEDGVGERGGKDFDARSRSFVVSTSRMWHVDV